MSGPGEVKHRLFYCDHYAIPLPAGHKFPMSKYRMLRDLLAGTGCFRLEAAPLADPEVIELTHEPAYVRDFLKGALTEAALRRIGFPWSRGLVDRTLASVGGTLAATCDAFDSGWEETWRVEPIMPSAPRAPDSACSTISP